MAHVATPVTHRFEPDKATGGPRLVLSITDQTTGRSLAARFTVFADGVPYTPPWVDENGIRFTSTHHSKKQFFTALYAKGTGPVALALPARARNVEVIAARGFEYLAGRAAGELRADRMSLEIKMARWSNLERDGWVAVDEHLHYDRLDATDDQKWFTLLEADGLAAGHFMVLKGGMVPGIWAKQFAYGPAGQARDAARLIVPGQEYRDLQQGHVNLLGIDAIIEPISTGGMGTPPVFENFPPLHDVLQKARAMNAVVGVAHGGTAGRHATAIADAVLGAVDFWELSNGFIYDTDAWYRLMNCGYFLPPAAGTDLPNSPYRDAWQPMLGSVRMYVNTGGRVGFDAFKTAVSAGRVFITGGPLIDFKVNGKPAGETIELPREGGTVIVIATASSPLPLRELRVVHDGADMTADVDRRVEASIHRWTVERKIRITKSGWLSAWAKGAAIESQKIDAMAHASVVRVNAGGAPVRSREDAAHFIRQLTEHRAFYQSNGIYARDADRKHATDLFDRAIGELRKREER